MMMLNGLLFFNFNFLTLKEVNFFHVFELSVIFWQFLFSLLAISLAC